MKKRTKRFYEGGLNDDTPPSDSGISGGLPPLFPSSKRADTYYNKLQDFYLDNSSADFRNKKIPNMTLSDVAKIPKEAGLLMATGIATPFAGMADDAIAGTKKLKKDYAQYQQKKLRDDIADSEDAAVGNAPTVVPPFKAQPLTKDQIAGKEKVENLRRTYGPSQDERDRMKRGGMKKGGTVKMAKGGSVKSSAASRGDGCCVKGKTKGRIV
jgi:hypothetical protein